MKKMLVFLITLLLILSFNSLSMAGQAHGGNGPVVHLPQDPAKNPRSRIQPQQWGIASPSISQISAFQFVPYNSTMTIDVSTDNMRYKTNAGDPSVMRASTNLPSGVKVEGIEIYGCDSNNALDPQAGDIYAWLTVCTAGTCTWYGDNVTNGLPSPSCDFFYYDLSAANITIDNFTSNYFVEVRLSANNDTNRFQNFNVYYSRQISSAPSSATFSDVPTTHLFFQEIEALAAAGITGGCGGGNYCPDLFVTRGQMAAFLSRAFGLYWPY